MVLGKPTWREVHEKKTNGRIPDEAREHVRNARQEMRKSVEGLLPEGFLEHRKAARKEMLMAFRSLIDAAIQRTDNAEE